MIYLKVFDESCVGTARRAVILMAQRLDFDDILAGKLAIIVTELATNLVKYANATGELFIYPLPDTQDKGIEILAIDKGPGMTNLSQCLSDGYSTKNTPGTGLGAIMRLASFFNIYSVPEHGTIAIAQVSSVSSTQATLPHKLVVGSLCLPHPCETVGGDNWAIHQTENRALFLVADGLGHGPDAGAASKLACQTFIEHQHLSVLDIVASIDKALRKSRGAAIAVAEINFAQQTLRFAGLGNITGVLYKENNVRHLITRNGVAGLGYLNMQEMVYPWERNAVLIIHSDGLLSLRGDFLKKYPSIITRHPAIIAGLLYRDFNRGNDDLTVIVTREKDTFQVHINE